MRFLALLMLVGCGADTFMSAGDSGTNPDSGDAARDGTISGDATMMGPCVFQTPGDAVFCDDFETSTMPGQKWSKTDFTGSCAPALELAGSPVPNPPLMGPRIFSASVPQSGRCSIIFDYDAPKEAFLSFAVYQFHTTQGATTQIARINYENYTLALGVNSNGGLEMVESGAWITVNTNRPLNSGLGGSVWHAVTMDVRLPNTVIVRIDGNEKYNGPPGGMGAAGALGKGHFAIGNDASQGPFVYKFDDVVIRAN